MSLTIELDKALADAVEEAARQEGMEPLALVESAVRARIGTALRKPRRSEKKLLAAIALGLPSSLWDRYRELRERRGTEALAAAEHEELIRLSDQIEEWNARRVELVVELARLRGEPFPELMQRLGLETPPDA